MQDIKTGHIEISGLAELERKLEAFPDHIARNILAGAIRAGAVVIRNEAKLLAPTSEITGPVQGHIGHYLGKGSKRTLILPGTLRKSIKVRLAPRKKRDQPIEYWVYVSKRTWYWKFVEFGTSKMPSHPFMRPAFDKMKNQATEAIRAYLAARIEREASR